MQQYASAIRLMRIPFSLFLMPVYWFAVSQAGEWEWFNASLIFLVLHMFVYPASNGYNSYFDRDEGSIGGLRRPPAVTPALWHCILLFDALAVGIGLLVGYAFAAFIAVYLLISKAYSWDRIRLKRFPILSTLIVTLFQGAMIYLAVLRGLEGTWQPLLQQQHWYLAGVSTLFLLGSYPLTQIYQHEEDAARGDRTLSLVLGKRGTLLFSAAAFGLATVIMGKVFIGHGETPAFMIFLGCMAPVVGYFGYWAWQVFRNPAAADFDRTMRMNMISSLSLSLAFILVLVLQH